jgi:hypothetical protein
MSKQQSEQYREITTLIAEAAFIGYGVGKRGEGKDKFMMDVAERQRAVIALVEAQLAEREQDLLFDLDEIDNKPWRVFRQLAVLVPDCADTYRRYERFYSYGGGLEVEKLIEIFEQQQALADTTPQTKEEG